MKKKAIKIAASTAVAASAFVAAAPAHQADAAVNVNQLVSDAQNAGTVLKWAISVEGSADFVTQPFAQYNAAKKSIAAAEAAAAKLSVSEKLSVDAKLVDAKIQVTRAGYYIDAITSSNKIKALTTTLDAAIASGDIEKVEAAYHPATGEFRKQAKLLDRVYGQTTRDEIRNAVKPALEKSVASVKNEVTVNMLVKAAAADVKAGKIADAHAKLAEAQAILDANKLKWATELQKSVTDAKTAAPAIPGNITVDTAAFHGEKGQTYAVTANIKTTTGAAYNGVVEVSFDGKGKNGNGDLANTYQFVKVGANTVNTSTPTTVDVVNGQLVLTVTSASEIAGGKIKFKTLAANGNAIDTQSSGTLNFYDKETGTANLDSKEVKYVDAANNYFVTTDLKKYTLSANGNVFQDTNNAVITLDAFKAKLAAGDLLRGSYNYNGGSVIQLWVHKVAEAEFALDQEVKAGTPAYRVEGNTVTLSGSGEAGKLVYIYKGTDNVGALTQVQVGSNGLWSTSVAVTTDNTIFTVRQATSVNETPKTYSQAVATGETEKVTVTPGKFVATTSYVGDNSKSLAGKTVVFASTKDGASTAVVASNAQITLLDGDLTRATYVNGVNGTTIVESAAGFDIKFGAPSTISGGNGVLDGQLTVTSVTGITNAYKLQVNASGTISGY
ncbi:hypothetical protein PB01_03630 [Psychrobacillus glaciei]|uniref:SbsC C-terminal domain-containing protein n=1 Tax=Psychrobacillus glaciei TaxID=2283160 RepID=A0A5J6SJX6_9BACI|nr:hypothetical protein [Psychrobacillus glaciei]QFF97979.1 hypothetical protein PB01_03630 [Psychrobacillus glaciei]